MPFDIPTLQFVVGLIDNEINAIEKDDFNAEAKELVLLRLKNKIVESVRTTHLPANTYSANQVKL